MPDPSEALPARLQIPVQDTWDTYSVFPNDAAWEAACQDIQGRLPQLAGFEGRLGDGPAVLLDWLNFYGETTNLMEKVFFYAYAFYAVDTADQAANARVGLARSLNTELQATSAFAVPELMDLGFEKLRSWMAEEPHLDTYSHYFQRLEDRQRHIRSAEVEAVLALVSDPFGTASSTAELAYRRGSQICKGCWGRPERARGRPGNHRKVEVQPRPGSAPNRLGKLCRWTSGF